MTFFAYPKELERLPSHLPLSSAGWGLFAPRVECIPNRAGSLAEFFLHGHFLLFRKNSPLHNCREPIPKKKRERVEPAPARKIGEFSEF
jgi:hypothetical protein